jgi:hypothetical protein
MAAQALAGNDPKARWQAWFTLEYTSRGEGC